MSEADGDIPGASVGYPGHPNGTHIHGKDIDVSYYQRGTADNTARAICAHYNSSGYDVNHCTATPHLLDEWRTALFLGALFEHPRLRIVGADGQAGHILDSAIEELCRGGWLTDYACGRTHKLAYEVTNQGNGWYYFHHHHLHISYNLNRQESDGKVCLIPGCEAGPLRDFLRRMGITDYR
jgi:hypothetical protein